MLETPLIWTLTAVDMAVLLVAGVATSALVWLLVETAKRRVPAIVDTPVTPWLPLILGLALTGALFPPALTGVAPEHTVPPGVQWTLVAVLGIVCGAGARVAHRWARGALDAAFGRIVRWAGGEE